MRGDFSSVIPPQTITDLIPKLQFEQSVDSPLSYHPTANPLGKFQVVDDYEHLEDPKNSNLESAVRGQLEHFLPPYPNTHLDTTSDNTHKGSIDYTIWN